MPCCPINSHPEILRYVQSRPEGIITKTRGGSGVMVEIVDILITKYKLNVDYNYLFELDKREKF